MRMAEARACDFADGRETSRESELFMGSLILPGGAFVRRQSSADE